MDKASLPAAIACAASLFPVVAVVFLGRLNPRLRARACIVVAAVSLALVATSGILSRGQVSLLNLPTEMPPLGMSFVVDPLGLYFGVIVCGVWLLVSIYSVAYFEHDERAGRFLSASMVSFAGTLGVAFAGDMFALFLFFELMSLAAYVLIIHDQTQEAVAAGFKYLLMTIGGSLGIFFGLIATFHASGTLNFYPGQLGARAGGLVAFVGYLTGFGIKAGLFPLHIWLPDAHPVAPSPASALLSGLMIKTGAIGLIRVFWNFYGRDYLVSTGWITALLVLSAVTIFLGSAVAILQEDMKRRLAYSSVAQIGYVLIGVGLLNETALTGALFHIFGHALMKSALFMSAGAIIHETGKRKVADYSGMGKIMPRTMTSFSVAALSMVGIPPLVGFISKWHLAWGALDASMPWVVGLLLVSSFMNAIYYLPVVISAFFGQVPDDVSPVKERPSLWVPMAICAIGIFAVGLIFRNAPLTLARAAARALAGE